MKRTPVFLLFLAAASFFLLFNSHIPVTDPVEGNYALTAKEMLISGDWLSPRIYGQFWYDKPIMIYWLILASYKLFGINEFAARFPAAIFSAFSVCFLYWFTYELYKNRRMALVAAIVMATSLEYWILAKLIITDAVLFFFSSVTMATLYLAIENKGRKWSLIAYIAAALAVLTKGPVGIVLPGITIIIYIAIFKKWDMMKKLVYIPGIVVFLVVTLPWYLYMYQVHGNDFVNTFLGLHNYIRATISEHPKDNVVYYYLVLFPLSLLPWTGIFLRMTARLVREFKLPHINYLVIWPGVIIIFYTLMATKYPTYVFPAIFPVAILIARYIEQMLADGGKKQWLWLTVPTGLLLLAISIGVEILSPVHTWTAIYVVTAIAFCVILWAQLKTSGYKIFKLVVGLTMILILTVNSQVYTFYADMRSAKKAVQYLPPQGAKIASYGNYPVSGVFYSGYSIANLVDNTSESLQNLKWAGKYTMPTETIRSFNLQTQGNSETYVIVDGNRLAGFGDMDIAQQFAMVSLNGKTVLYKRVR
ncbi:MAG: hypothetical protein H6Q74_2307 [Firmicutes bacterium]|nr:hypothetical protein [Bacillota bacterium]